MTEAQTADLVQQAADLIEALDVLPANPEADAFFDRLAVEEIERRTVRKIQRREP